MLIWLSVRAAYAVFRSPSLEDQDAEIFAAQEPLPLEKDGSFDDSPGVMEGAWTENAIYEDSEIMIKKEEHEEEVIKELPLAYLVHHPFGIKELIMNDLDNARPGYFDFPIIPPYNFHDSISGSCDTFFETLYHPHLGFVDMATLRAFSMSLPNSRLGLDNLYQEWVKEEWRLAHFDYELASSPIFVAQLEEYQQRVAQAEHSGYQQRLLPQLEPFEISLAKLKQLDEMSERLQVWPEKITQAATKAAECSRIVEADCGSQSPMPYADEFGEAGEVMDLRTMADMTSNRQVEDCTW